MLIYFCHDIFWTKNMWTNEILDDWCCYCIVSKSQFHVIKFNIFYMGQCLQNLYNNTSSPFIWRLSKNRKLWCLHQLFSMTLGVYIKSYITWFCLFSNPSNSDFPSHFIVLITYLSFCSHSNNYHSCYYIECYTNTKYWHLLKLETISLCVRTHLLKVLKLLKSI